MHYTESLHLVEPSLLLPKMDPESAQRDATILAHFVSAVFRQLRSDNNQTGLQSPDTSNEFARLRAFVERVVRIMKLGRAAVIYSMAMTERFCTLHPAVNKINHSHYGLFISGMMMANKFLDDATYSNKTWAKLTGQSIREINRMERSYLERLNFNLSIDPASFSHWAEVLDVFEQNWALRPKRRNLDIIDTRRVKRPASLCSGSDTSDDNSPVLPDPITRRTSQTLAMRLLDIAL